MNPIIKEFEYGRHNIRIETGKVAKQSTGSVMVFMDDTAVLTTVVGAKTMGQDRIFSRLPLTIRRRPTLRVRYQAVFLGERAVQVKKKL